MLFRKCKLGTLFGFVLTSVLVPLLAPIAMVDSMVAVVNDKVITSRDLLGYVELSRRQFEKISATEAQFIRQNLNEIVQNEIKRQYASSRNISVTEDEIKAGMVRLAKINNKTEAQIKKLTQGLEGAFRDKIAVETLWDKFVRTELLPQINISTAEIDRIIRDILAGDVVSEREISQIFLPTGSEASDNTKASEIIQRASKELQDGQDFATTAQKFGTSPSAEKGGYLGWFAEGALNTKLENALKSAEVGDIIGPLETDAGWHIVKIHRVKKAPAITFDPIDKLRLYEISVAPEVETSLKKALGKNKFLGDLQKNENIILVDKEWQSVESLTDSVRRVLPKKTGLSTVVKTAEGERAFYVANRKREMADNLLRLRTKVETQLRGNKVRQLERKVLRELRSQAFIELAPDVIQRVRAAAK